jgi:transcription elongation factor Elf1
MRTCPECGRVLSNKLSYGPGRSVALIWICPVCGAIPELTDRTGLRHIDVIDRYKLNGEVNK